LGRDALPFSAETVTGDITAVVDADANLTLRLATSGEITVDFPIDIDYRYLQEPAKHGRIVLGDGTTLVDLKSRQGTIRVLRK
jgi:hypothetical protein